MAAELAAPGVYSPIQSLGVGLDIPLQAAVIALPRATVAGLAVRVVAPPVTVKELLVARGAEAHTFG
jgi:hypothetical protein